MLELLDKFGAPHQSVKLQAQTPSLTEAFGQLPSGLAFIQYLGPEGGEYSGWTSWSRAYANTHWIAYDKGLVYDFNTRHTDGTLGDWIPEPAWRQYIAPTLGPRTEHLVKNILVPKD
jgi:hypothetical protein